MISSVRIQESAEILLEHLSRATDPKNSEEVKREELMEVVKEIIAMKKTLTEFIDRCRSEVIPDLKGVKRTPPTEQKSESPNRPKSGVADIVLTTISRSREPTPGISSQAGSGSLDGSEGPPASASTARGASRGGGS
mmetsp:Transcript_26140/g.46039  ORF Transcript_26140/g.46039 Transcript_26140/m.46039 type:complete len:137 (+) Transcript_26140:3-413(+)